MERRLIEDYCALINGIVGRLNQANLAAAVELARAAYEIGGYGPVKKASVSAYWLRLKALQAGFEETALRTRAG